MLIRLVLTEINPFENVNIYNEMYGHRTPCLVALHFFVNFDIFRWLYLAYYWAYLHQTWGFCSLVCTLWLCESIVANLIIYGLVSIRPSRYEIRQFNFGSNSIPSFLYWEPCLDRGCGGEPVTWLVSRKSCWNDFFFRLGNKFFSFTKNCYCDEQKISFHTTLSTRHLDDRI